MPPIRSTVVFGPAYIDRILRFDVPLRPSSEIPTLDRSVTGQSTGNDEDRTRLEVIGGDGAIVVDPLPPGWPGLAGRVELRDSVLPWTGAIRVAASSWHEDLGGMGAGFAAALDGTWIGLLGDDDLGRTIQTRLAVQRIDARPIVRPDRMTDWTLLLSSGSYGDKLPIGFRGCQDDWTAVPVDIGPLDLLVVAGGANRWASAIFDAVAARIRVFAPSMRNMRDFDSSVLELADRIELLTCNRREWEALDDRDVVAARVPLLAITDGPSGSRVAVRDRSGNSNEIVMPAFPREVPPRDTNRAGEAYAATLIRSLIDSGWTPGNSEASAVERAARRASAAAAIVLDFEDFRFPTPDEIDRALREGIVRSTSR